MSVALGAYPGRRLLGRRSRPTHCLGDVPTIRTFDVAVVEAKTIRNMVLLWVESFPALGALISGDQQPKPLERVRHAKTESIRNTNYRT